MVGTKTQLNSNRIRTFIADPRSDRELLERFHATEDSEAFAELVRRYGPMVLGICKRAIRDPHRAEDAFQASFLVLLKKSRTIRDGAIGPWLSGVARKVSLACLSRTPREQSVSQLPERYMDIEPSIDRDVLVHLERELDRLPQIQRDAVDLCELRGVSRSEAARILGIAEGTLSSRLAVARKTLATRLAKRGVAISAAGLGVIWSHRAVALAPSLFIQTLRLGDSSTTTVTSLAEGVLSMMTPSKLFTSKLAALAVCLCVGLGIVAASDPAKSPDANSNDVKSTAAKAAADRPAINDTSRIVLLLDEEVRYFKTDGSCGQVITYRDAKKLEPELVSGIITLPFHVKRYLSSHGRPAPDGSIILETKVGLKKLIPGTTPNIQGLDNELDDWFVNKMKAWSADGNRFVASVENFELLAGITSFQTYLYDFTTDDYQLLPLEKECELVDWSDSANALLTIKHKKQGGLFASLTESGPLCLLSMDGKLIKELARENEYCPTEIHLSPDSKSVAYFGKSNEKNDKAWVLKLLDIETKTERVLNRSFKESDFELPYAFRIKNKLAWSPDSSQVMLLKVQPAEKTRSISELTATIYDREGNGSRTVSLGQAKSDNFARHLEWQAVRSSH